MLNPCWKETLKMVQDEHGESVFAWGYDDKFLINFVNSSWYIERSKWSYILEEIHPVSNNFYTTTGTTNYFELLIGILVQWFLR